MCLWVRMNMCRNAWIWRSSWRKAFLLRAQTHWSEGSFCWEIEIVVFASICVLCLWACISVQTCKCTLRIYKHKLAQTICAPEIWNVIIELLWARSPLHNTTRLLWRYYTHTHTHTHQQNTFCCLAPYEQNVSQNFAQATTIPTARHDSGKHVADASSTNSQSYVITWRWQAVSCSTHQKRRPTSI